MAQDWIELTQLTGNNLFLVEQVKLPNKNIKITGEFELPPLAKLSAEDQVFVMAFVRCHGSIKEMEAAFGISYPTVKNRLTKIAAQFEFTVTLPVSSKEEILARLERGEITADEAIEKLKK
ncbi:MAG: DUF2089 domain-containing protein [Dehalococcoidales bacterium]